MNRKFFSGVLAVSVLVLAALLLYPASAFAAAPPNPTNISPNNGRQGQWMEGVEISGTDFGTDQSNVSIRLENGLDTIPGNVWNVSDTLIRGEFHIPTGATLGAWNVVVEHNDDHLTGTIPGGLTINVGSSISGTVTHDGSGVPSIQVVAVTDNGGDNQGTASAVDGTYTIGGLAPGARYMVIFLDQTGTYAFEYYNDKNTWNSATEVSAPSSGIDEELEDGVTITGTVKDAVTNDPIPNCYVAWSDSTSDVSPFSVQTGLDGTYTLSGLKSDVGYKVSFNVNTGGSPPLPYTPRWYNGKYNWSEADIVTAPDDSIDAQLDTIPAATISGTVTSAGGPLENILVIAFLSSSGDQSSMAATAPDGTYTLSSLSPGTDYKIVFYDESSHYAIEFYNDAGTWDTAIEVVGGATGINAVMEDAVTITGTVRDAITHNPIPDCTVAWADSTLDDLYPPSVQTDINGFYTLPGLMSGTGYKVSFTPPVPYYAQWYNGKPDWTHADLVTGGSLEIDANLYSDPPPTVTGVSPVSGQAGNTFEITVSGTDFQDGAVARLERTGQTSIDLGVSYVNPTTLTNSAFTLPYNTLYGNWDVVVENPDHQQATAPSPFNVTWHSPSGSTIDPNVGNRGSIVHATLQGQNFHTGAQVNLAASGHHLDATNEIVNAEGTEITCDLDLTDAMLGVWGGVVVTNADGQYGFVPNGFTVYQQQYDVNASVTGGHGTALPTTQQIDQGSNATISITPEDHYHVSSITDNGVSKAITNPYTITNVAADHNVVVTFKEIPVQTSKWYLAEGSTKWGFDTYISILNPNDTEVNTTLKFFTSETPLAKTLTVPANSQTTFNAKDYIGNADFSTSIESDQNKPIAVDRTMMWTGQGSGAPEAHSSVGVTSPDNTWYLAEGSTDWNFECWLLIQNPNNQDATCNVTYMTNTGPQTFTKTVPANTRQTYNMASDIGNKDASIKVDSDVAVIAERSMYRYNRREGHESIGTTAPSNDYYLAEGSTAWGFATYILVQNPNDATNNITLTCFGGMGAGKVWMQDFNFSMAPNTRMTVKANDLKNMSNVDFSTTVHGDKPIIAERAMYWNSYAGETCHDSIGFSAPHKNFYMPDGAVTDGWETWTLIQNPNDKEVTVNVTYLARDGSKAPVTFKETMPAKSRKTLNMVDKVNYNCGIKVTCSDPIMVERSMYKDSRALGTNTIGGFSD